MDAHAYGWNGDLPKLMGLSSGRDICVHACLQFNFISGAIPPSRANRVDDRPTFQAKGRSEPDFTDRTRSKQLRRLLQFGASHRMDGTAKS